MTAYAVSPEGVVTKFPRANRISWQADGTAKLHESEKSQSNGYMIARIPADHIISFDQPGVEFKGKPKCFTFEAALDIVARGIRSAECSSRYSPNFDRLRKIKDQLRSFDARGAGWNS